MRRGAAGRRQQRQPCERSYSGHGTDRCEGVAEIDQRRAPKSEMDACFSRSRLLARRRNSGNGPAAFRRIRHRATAGCDGGLFRLIRLVIRLGLLPGLLGFGPSRILGARGHPCVVFRRAAPRRDPGRLAAQPCRHVRQPLARGAAGARCKRHACQGKKDPFDERGTRTNHFAVLPPHCGGRDAQSRPSCDHYRGLAMASTTANPRHGAGCVTSEGSTNVKKVPQPLNEATLCARIPVRAGRGGAVGYQPVPIRGGFAARSISDRRWILSFGRAVTGLCVFNYWLGGGV